MIREQAMQDVSLKFRGGPIDGETRHRQVNGNWTVLRFEVPSSTELRHVYAGCRASSTDTDIPMQYLGLRRSEGGADD